METLTETEYRLMVVIWEKQNLTSMELVNICMTCLLYTSDAADD